MIFIKGVVIIMMAVSISACNFASGSYPYVEKYNIPMSESKLIEAIKKFKSNNPEYVVPDTLQLIDGRDTTIKDDHWYHIYFLYQKESQIIYAWTRPIDKNNTSFALVSVNEGLKIGNWKDINIDFNTSENREQKEKFKRRIVDKIYLIE